MIQKMAAMLAVVSIVAGCGGPPSGAGVSEGAAGGETAGRLVRTDSAGLVAYFRDALRSGDGDVGSDAVVLAEAVGAGASQRGVSTTNLQVAGVDEADLIKTTSDGRVLYALDNRGDFAYPAGPSSVDGSGVSSADTPRSAIRVMAVADDGGLSVLADIGMDDPALQQQGLYLSERLQRLMVIDQAAGAVHANWFRPWYFIQQRTRLRFVDVSEPARATVVRTIGFDGALVASRRVGEVVYLVLRHHPDPSVAVEDPAGADTLTPEALLPRYRIDGVDRGLLVTPADCYLNRDTAQRWADVITIVAVDLTSDGDHLAAQCYVGASEALYASTSALYLASTRHPYRVLADGIVYEPEVTTDIHRFDFDRLAIAYRGSAEVEGHLGWRQDQKSFRFSESADGHLRVVTYRESRRFVARPVDIVLETDEVPATPGNGVSEVPERSPVMLTILKASAGRQVLEVVSTLPNPRRPAPLGRPGEQLYGTRYVGDRAYLVTFRVTDPLYVVDLSDPTDPYIAGELKVSGYSDYLHPVTETLLLGIGKAAVPARGVTGDIGGAWYQGIKLSLIDVSDPARPLEVDKVEIGRRGTDSTALHDHHAITTLTVDGRMRVVLPVALHDRPPPYGDPASPDSHFGYTHTGLYRFEIDPATQRIDTALEPLIVADYRGGDWGDTRNDRGVLIGDWVHYLHEGRFWSRPWRGGETTGPK